MTVFHVSTVFLLMGLLYLILPMTVWMALFRQPSRGITLWCLGGVTLGLGLILVGLRAVVPVVISYPVANLVMWTGVVTQIAALRYSLSQNTSIRIAFLLLMLSLSAFEFCRQILQNAVLRFTCSMFVFTFAFTYISYLGWQISKHYQLRSARWFSFVYSITAIVMFIRMGRALLGISEPDAISQGLDSYLTVATGFLITIFGNFAYIGVVLEASTRREMNAIEQRARQDESFRLGEQIAQLERQRTLGTMSSSFAHELSQPLTAILMDAQNIKSTVVAGTSNMQEIIESVEEIEKNTYRTVTLVERIRNFIRPAHNEYKRVDLRTVLQDVANLLAFEIRKNNVKIDLEFDGDACLVEGDRVQLSQIVLNVYRNAIQAMQETKNKRIMVTLEAVGERVVLRVRDYGSGIADELKDTVGQPFVTTKKEGLGVGLSISCTIAEMHSGSLSISNVVDGGAIVELNLPAFQS
jgi:signal transduction histidine kinase